MNKYVERILKLFHEGLEAEGHNADHIELVHQNGPWDLSALTLKDVNHYMAGFLVLLAAVPAFPKVGQQ